MAKRYLTTLLKISVTALGLYLALRQAPFSELAAVIRGADWRWLLLAWVLIFTSLAVRASRWWLLLRGVNIHLPLRRLIEIYFIGQFFNAFLPSGFGGDVVRALSMGKEVRRSEAAGSVMVDRLSGLLMLFVMALLAMPFRPQTFPLELALLISAMAVGGLVGGWLLLYGQTIHRISRWAGRWLPSWLATEGEGPLARLIAVIQRAGQRAVFGALAVSVVFNLMLVGWWTAVSYALQFNVPYSYYLLVVPILSVALLAPSIGGLGVREVIAPLLLLGAGLTPAQAIALSLVEFALVRFTGLIGAPIYLLRR